MADIPDSMLEEIELFTAMVRSQSGQDSAYRYSEFICENVFSVIENSFPLFFSTQNEDYIRKLSQEFVHFHHAVEPEFHHIATEFVRFSQQKLNLTVEIRKLIEYEWTIFSTEIDVMQMGNHGDLWDVVEDQSDDITVRLNSLIELIEVPFLVSDDSVRFLSEGDPLTLYCIYRTQDHQVVSQQLRPIDVAIIQLISESSNLTLTQIEQNIHTQLVDFDFIDWIQCFNESQLINIEYLGDKND